MTRTLAIVDLAIGALLRHRSRTIAVGAVFAFVVALFASVLLVTASLRHEYSFLLQNAPDVVVQRTHAGRPADVPLAAIADIRTIPGIRGVRPRVWGYFFLPALENNVTIYGIDGADRLGDLGAAVERGRAPRTGERHVLVLGRALADLLHVGIGHEIGFERPGGTRSVYFRVVGLFGSPSALVTADAMAMPTEDARAFLGVPDDAATDLAVDLSTPDEADVVGRKIAEFLPEARVIERRLQARTYEIGYGWRSGLLLLALLPAALAFAVLLWDRATALGDAQRREIGILKAVGWETRDVLLLEIAKAAVLGLLATTAGLAAASVYVHVLGAPGLIRLLGGWSVLLPRFDLRPALGAGDLAALVGTITLPYVLAAAVPAWRAATLEPDEAIRG